MVLPTLDLRPEVAPSNVLDGLIPDNVYSRQRYAPVVSGFEGNGVGHMVWGRIVGVLRRGRVTLGETEERGTRKRKGTRKRGAREKELGNGGRDGSCLGSR